MYLGNMNREDLENMGFDKNLDNIKSDFNLFGEEVPRYACVSMNILLY